MDTTDVKGLQLEWRGLHERHEIDAGLHLLSPKPKQCDPLWGKEDGKTGSEDHLLDLRDGMHD